MPIDPDVIHRKVSFIRKDLARVEKLAQLPYDAFEHDFEHEASAERLLERIVGRLIDIN